QKKYQSGGRESRGPAIFYGYSPESRGMRMMDYSEYVNSLQETYSEMYSAVSENASRALHSLADSIEAWMPEAKRYRKYEEEDCHCRCCICDADTVEYARCGEVRVIPITFENDTRRERDVKLEFNGFATGGGRELGWDANLSENSFKLLACGEKTILLRVVVDCRKFG